MLDFVRDNPVLPLWIAALGWTALVMLSGYLGWRQDREQQERR